MPQKVPPSVIEEDLRQVNERYAEFKTEFVESELAPRALLYDDERLLNILNRLSFWAGVFNGFKPRSKWYEQQQEYLFTFRLHAVNFEIDRLFDSYKAVWNTRRDLAAATAPAAASANPAPPRPTRVEQTPHEVSIIRITSDTQRNKATDLATLRNMPSYGLGQFYLEPEPPAEFCGAIHMTCVHSTTRGRCCKKMAHGIEVRDTQHQCRMCGQTFSR